MFRVVALDIQAQAMPTLLVHHQGADGQTKRCGVVPNRQGCADAARQHHSSSRWMRGRQCRQKDKATH
jgi:hypothetical protein